MMKRGQGRGCSLSRKYRDDPAWQMPGRHNAVDTLLIILACGGIAIFAMALAVLLVVLIIESPFRFW